MICVFSTFSLNTRGRYCGFAGLSVALGMISPVLEAATVSLPESITTTQVISSTATTTSILPSAPDGAENRSAAMMMAGDGVGDSILDGFSFATSAGATYDSNVNRAPGTAAQPEEDDFFLSLGGSVKYMSKATDWTFGGSYKGSYDAYFDNSDNSGFNHDADLVANYDGGRLKASVQTGVDVTRGFNRFYANNSSSSFIEVTNYSTALLARYRLSPKSALVGNISQRFSTASGGNYSDTESLDIGAAALWKYSPLTEVGPGLRYTYRGGDAKDGRSAVGPTLNANYKLSSKVALNSRVGVDFPWYDDGSSADPTFSTAIGLNYKASKLWGMNFSLYRDNQADPAAAGQFYEITATRLGYVRKIRRATVNLGLGYESTTYESTTGTPKDDRDYFTLDGSVGMPVFSGSCLATFFMKYSDQSGPPSDTWEAFQTGLSISRKF